MSKRGQSACYKPERASKVSPTALDIITHRDSFGYKPERASKVSPTLSSLWDTCSDVIVLQARTGLNSLPD